MKKRFGIIKKASRIGLLVIMILLIFVIISAIIYYKSESYSLKLAYEAKKYLEKNLNRTVELDAIKLSLIPFGFRVDELIIYGPHGPKEVPFCRLEKVILSVDILKLFQKRIIIRNVKLENAHINIIYYEDGKDNFISIKKKKKDDSKSNIDFEIKTIEVSSMKVLFKHEGIPLTFSTPNLNANFIYDRALHGFKARLNFYNAGLQIRDYNTWRFNSDMKFIARGEGLEFDYIYFYSKGIKMVNGGVMLNYKKRIFDLKVFVDYKCEEVMDWFKIPIKLGGRGYFIGTYKGTFSRFEIDGDYYINDFQIYKLRYDVLSGQFWMNDDELIIKSIYGEIGGGDFEGKFKIKPLHGKSYYSCWAKFNGSRLEEFARWFQLLPIKPVGVSNFEGSLGWYEDGFKKFSGDFVLQFNEDKDIAKDYYSAMRLLDEAVEFPTSGYIKGKLLNYAINDFDAEIKTNYSDYSIKGDVGFNGDLNLHAEADTKLLPEVDVLYHLIEARIKDTKLSVDDLWEIKGGTHFTGKVYNSIFDIKFDGFFEGKDVVFRNVLWGACKGYVKYANRVFNIAKIDVNKGGNRFYADYAVFNLGEKGFFEDGDVSTKVSFQKYDLATIIKALKWEIPFEGSLLGTIEIKGSTDKVKIRTDTKILNAVLYNNIIDTLEFKLNYFDKKLEIRDLTLLSGLSEIRGGGGIIMEDYIFNDVVLSMKNVPLMVIGKLLGIEMSGSIDGSVRAKGSLMHPEGKLELIGKNFEIFGVHIGDAELEINGDEGKYFGLMRKREISKESRTIGELNFVVDTLKENRYSLNLFLNKYPVNIPISALYKGAQSLEGYLTTEIKSEGKLDNYKKDGLILEISNSEFKMEDLNLKNSKKIEVKIKGGSLEIKESKFLFNNREFFLRLNANLINKIINYIYIKGSIDLRIARNFVEGLRIDGDGDVEIEGINKGGVLRYEGTVGVKKGNLKYKEFPLILSSVNGVIEFQKDEILIRDIKARSGSGQVWINGVFKMEEYKIRNFIISAGGEEIKFNYPEEMISYGNFNINWFGTTEASIITGDVVIKQALWNKEYSIESILEGAKMKVGENSESGLDKIKLNLHVVAPQNVYFQAKMGNLEVLLDEKIDLYIINTVDKPVLIGRAQSSGGTIKFLGNDFKVSNGIIDFINPVKTMTQVSFKANTYIGEYMVELNLSGTTDNFLFQFSSEPPLSQSDIWALISGHQIKPGQRTSLTSYAQDSAIAALGSAYITNPVLGTVQEETKSILGLSKLEISPTNLSTETNPSAKITLNKYITKDLSITYSSDLTSSKEQIVLIEYRIAPGVIAVASRNEKGYYGLDFRLSKTF